MDEQKEKAESGSESGLPESFKTPLTEEKATESWAKAFFSKAQELREKLAAEEAIFGTEKSKMTAQEIMDGHAELEELYREIERLYEAGNMEYETEKQVKSWEKFYREIFQFNADFSGLKILERKSPFDRLIIVSQGTEKHGLFHKCMEFSHIEARAGMTVDGMKSERTNQDGPYAIWVENDRDPAQKNQKISAKYFKAQKIKTITEEEMLLFQLKCFHENGGYLNENIGTLCSGSRLADGTVPVFSLKPGQAGLYTGSSKYTIAIDSIREDDEKTNFTTREVIAEK